MAVPPPAKYVFLPWVRQGFASGIETSDSLGAAQTGVVSVPVTLRINDTEDIPPRQVRLYGPGDVIGIDPQQVVRTNPRHLATDFEPNYFPAIEFDRPDFPWLFTPAKANTAGKLRPWICLVVVRKQEGVTLRVDPGLPLPVLDIVPPAQPERELPDLSESWAWAHAQVAGSQLDAASLAGDPALTVSRLLCPRRLDPVTEYLACVVPAFALGCKAGLGWPITSKDEEMLQLAWCSGAQVTLPVYFHWEFRTGSHGDFEALAELLVARGPHEMLGVGTRPMDISRPGFKIAPELPELPEGTMLEIEGALRLFDAPTADWPPATRTLFQAELKKILDAPRQAMQQEGNTPLLAPPIYGSWHAARHTVEIIIDSTAPLPSPLWLHELNLDPRHRAVAALGTKVVQDQQEQLMASAWEQLGDFPRINQVRRQAQLGRAVNAMYYAKHFSRFSAETLLNVVAPVQSRVVVAKAEPLSPGTELLSRRMSRLARAVSAPVHRLTSPRGVISARFARFLAADAPSISIVDKLKLEIPIVPERNERQKADLVTMDRVSERLPDHFLTFADEVVRSDKVSDALHTAPPLGEFVIVGEGLWPPLLPGAGPSDSPDADAFRKAAQAHQAYIDRMFPSGTPIEAPPQPIDLQLIKGALDQSLNPEQTFKAGGDAPPRVARDAATHGDPLEPILDAPEFPHPMYEALRDLSQEFLLPGLEHVLPNTVALLETNPPFVESFLVGLNVEMGRELLWRGYPTDQRGTYFRRFWDTSAGDDGDIGMIHAWDNLPLGQNASKGEWPVLLIRSELRRRYPNSVIYAVQAVQGEDGQLRLLEHHPRFRGTLQPDVTFLGFDLNLADVYADVDHWFFVIQQQPTEPAFGLDVADFEKPRPPETPPLTKWDELSWRHLANTAEDLQALSHASAQKALLKPANEQAEWGRNAAHQAYITLQRPVRIVIHASKMLPPRPPTR